MDFYEAKYGKPRTRRGPRQLSKAEQKTEAARKNGGEENAIFELAAAMLLERAIEMKLECQVCGFQWEPGGLSDPLAVPLRPDGSLCARAGDFKEVGVSLPRALLLTCPACMEDPDGYAFSHGE